MSSPDTSPARRGPGRPPAFDRDAVIDKAVLVFRARGFHAASVDALSRGTGLAPGSLYKAFRDKKEIFAAAFARYLETRAVELAQCLAGAAPARERLAAWLDLYLRAASGVEGRRGCLVVASLAEAGGLDDAQRAALAAAVEANAARLAALLREGQADGSVRAGLDVAQAAAVLLALLQGIRVLGKLQDPAERAGFVATALKIVD